MSAVLVSEIARDGFLTGLEILQLIEVMEIQNRGRIVTNISDSGAGRAGIVVRNSLISRITLLVAGAFSPVRRGDRHLRQAFELLKDPQIRVVIENRGYAKILQASFDFWDDLNADPFLPNIKHFRNKYTAHSGEPDADIPIPNYTDFFNFAKKTAMLMEKLAHAVGGTTEMLDDTANERIASAQAFWAPWEFRR